MGIATNEHNIWEDPSARSFVRSVAGGNETVPTGAIGEVKLINPSMREVIAAIKAVDPDVAVNVESTQGVNSRQNLAVLQWAVIATLIALSFLVEHIGHARLSWGIDGVNVLF